MRFPRLVACALFWLAAAALHAQTLPVEYATFMSHGKAVSCAVYDAHDATATIIFLRGSGPSDLALGRTQARFFCRARFSCPAGRLFDALRPPSNSPPQTIAVGPRRSRISSPILRSRPVPRNRKIALIGQGLGASVALLAGSRKMGVDAIAEWSGLAPQPIFFPGAKPAASSHPSRRAG